VDVRNALTRLGLIAAWVSCLTAGTDAQRPRDEYDVKAAYLVKLGSFVEYPRVRDPKAFHVCVAGPDPFGSRLAREASGLTIDGRPIATRRLSHPREGRTCDVLFVARSATGDVAGTLAAVEGESVLTVSDAPQFTALGGMVQFVSRSGTVRFEVNLQPVQQSGLMVSSELVRHASSVRDAR
jgi:hypothetical protein